MTKPLIIPQHPTHDYACGKCKHYLKSETRRIVMSGQHAGKPLKDLIAAGINADNEIVSDLAPCTVGPSWTTAAPNHWCAQYESLAVETLARR